MVEDEPRPCYPIGWSRWRHGGEHDPCGEGLVEAASSSKRDAGGTLGVYKRAEPLRRPNPCALT